MTLTTVIVRLNVRTHEHWAITHNYKMGTWSIQRAGRLDGGTHYDPSLPEHRGFRTKKEAQQYKKEHLS